MKKFLILTLMLLLVVVPASAQDDIIILSSMPDLAFPFFVHMQDQIRDEAATLGGIELLEADGQSSVPKQTADVEAAIVQGAAGIVISPLDVAAMAPAVQQAVDAGLVVVTVDRRVEGVDGVLAHVGADNVIGGQKQAEWVIENYPDGASIFYLEGQPGSGPAIDRKAGAFEVIEAAGDSYEIVFEQTANFRREEGLSVTEAGLAGLESPPDVIIAANDDMALGALEAVTALGLDIDILGFDALPEALESVVNGGLAGTVEQFPGEQGRTALNLVVDKVNNDTDPENNNILLEPQVVTADNIMEAERIGEVEGMEDMGDMDDMDATDEPMMEDDMGEASGGAMFADEMAACEAMDDLTVASSMPDLAFPFFVHMQAEARDEAEVIGGITLIESDGQSSVPKQTADVEAAIVQGAQVMVISPLDVAAMAPAVQQAVDADMTVVTVDRRVEGVDGILAHVGADNVIGGMAQAEWVLENFPDGASVFYLEGQPGSGPAIDRKAGTFQVLEEAGDAYPIVFEQTANFRRDEGLSVTEAGLAGLETPPDVIIAANDDMALGALEAVTALGLDIDILGFDALPEALESVVNGGLAGTVEQFPGEQGRTALNLVVDKVNNDTDPENNNILLEPQVVTADNIMEAERIGEVEGMEDMGDMDDMDATDEPMMEDDMGEASGGAMFADEMAACEAMDDLTVASSMPDLAFPFFVHMQAEARDEAEVIGGITLIESDGQSSVPKQTADVEAAIVQGAQVMVISPLDVAAMAPAVQQAVDADMTVVTVDRRVEGVDGILAHVGADNVIGGMAQAEWVLENFPDGASVFYLEGQPGSGPAIDRKAGTFQVLEEAGDAYPIVFEQTANFRRDEGLSVTEAGLAGLETPPDVIIAANDDMALGALEAVTALGLDIDILGFDALPEALGSVQDGGLTGTVEQFPGGQVRTALRLGVLTARGCEVMAEDTILLNPVLLTADNVDSAERIGEVE